MGICDKRTTTLKMRMRRYKHLQGGHPGNESTNQRVARKIRMCLQKRQTVHIYALHPDVGCNYFGMEVDFVKGLENPLIAKLTPKWNR